MALTSWGGSRVRKQDVIIAKNYLNADEIDTLNRLVVIFLEGIGSVSHEHMKRVTVERYETFDQQRRVSEARAVDDADLKEIEQLEKDLQRKGRKPT